ncbi:MAG TPA: carboxypeptidase-like regulatory domain-containing protein [Solirubrobacterales bacterium]|nr:carboxypeptidase-like regulatory domain-containing protein [Solirubrobacterales bacterium]
MRGALIAVLALAGLACVSTAPAVAVAPSGSVIGQVSDAVGAAGIEGIEICAWGIEPTEDFGCALSDVGGAYTIAGLSPGNYVVEFWPGPLNYVGQWYDGKSFSEEPDLVTVSAGAATPGIDAVLQRGGEIEGTVVDNGPGELPIEGVEVVAFGVDGEESVGEARTDANGQYAIPGLPEGHYKVQFWDGSGQKYVTQYYDGKPSWGEAEAVLVEADVTTSAVDAAMQEGARIFGRLTDAESAAGLPKVEACALKASTAEFFDCSLSDPGGNYQLSRLPTGTYKVVFSLDPHEWFPEIPSQEDGYLTQFYDGKPTFAQADVVAALAPGAVTGVDARLRSTAPLPPVVLPALPPLAVEPVGNANDKPPARKCRKGKRKKRVQGRVRCVRVPRGKVRAHRGARGVRTLGLDRLPTRF